MIDEENDIVYGVVVFPFGESDVQARSKDTVLQHQLRKSQLPKLTKENQELVFQAILESVKADYPDYVEYKDDEPATGISFFSRLSSQYGFTYAKRTLPSLLYTELSPYVSHRLSETNFLKAWDGVIHLSTNQDIERALMGNMKQMKVNASLGKAIAKIVTRLVVELV